MTLARIGHIGWALCAVWAGVLVAWAIVEPDPYAGGWRLVLELAFLGRLVSVADGTANGFSNTYLLVQTGLQDVILFLVAYPVVVLAHEGSVRRGGWFGRRLQGLRHTAELHRRWVEPLGAIGLWAFVFFPFWSTGVMVGGIVGYLIGLPTRTVFVSVLTGHVISVVSLIWFFDLMASLAERLDGNARMAPWIVLAVLFVGMFLYQRVRAWRQT